MSTKLRSIMACPAGSFINEVDDRTAMGLPPSHVAAIAENTARLWRTLCRKDIGELVAIVESSTAEIEVRYAAGSLLAVFGDPRLETLRPAMIDVPAALVGIGTAQVDVSRIMREFGDTGILREWIEKECPLHGVRLAAFRIAKYPVTNQEFRDFLMATSYPEIPTSWTFGRMPDQAANHPVSTVSSAAADAYAAWLSARTGRLFRLPTEAEWEYAAAGAEGRAFPWGDTFDSSHCNTREAGFLTTTPVGMFPSGASPFGALDMAGNVEEYVADDYAAYPGGVSIADDLVTSQGTYRVARGGSFTRFRDLARCQRRHGRYVRSIYVMGFRLAETLKGKDDL